MNFDVTDVQDVQDFREWTPAMLAGGLRVMAARRDLSDREMQVIDAAADALIEWQQRETEQRAEHRMAEHDRATERANEYVRVLQLVDLLVNQNADHRTVMCSQQAPLWEQVRNALNHFGDRVRAAPTD